MSRVYDALQRSQGDNPSASPLATPLSETPAVESAIPPAAVPSEMAAQAEGVAAAAAPPVDFLQPEQPIMPAARPSSSYRTEVLEAGAAMDATNRANLLSTPRERILRPHPLPEQRLVALAEPSGPGAEMFRVLSTRLAHMQNKQTLRKLLITSSTGEEGKSVVAANLALTLAQRAGERTILIEADLRRPTVSALFSSSPLKGITDWAAGKLSLDDALYQVSGMPLWVLPAGHAMDEPLPLLESDRFAEMLQTLSTAFDWVVMDATPMLPMADATSLSRLCDGVLVVVREGHTRRKVLNKALETIEKHKLLGLVLNEASMLQIGYDRYYEGYGKDGRSGKKESKAELERTKVVSA